MFVPPKIWKNPCYYFFKLVIVLIGIRNKFGFLVNLSESLALSQAETAAAGGRLVSSDSDGDLGDRVNTHGEMIWNDGLLRNNGYLTDTFF